MHNGAIMPSEVRHLVDHGQAYPVVRLTGVLDSDTGTAVRSALIDVLAGQPEAPPTSSCWPPPAPTRGAGPACRSGTASATRSPIWASRTTPSTGGSPWSRWSAPPAGPAN
jgi:hypothetical protein